MTHTDDSMALPTPGRGDRWQPLRSGLLNLYRYTRQDFWFEHGHLLLRGNNGTGKSRVLALQLPFLLDGEVFSRRVEPDADPAKRMDWNVLMDVHDNRTGYTWIEFGRLDADGRAEYVTLGCGLHATRGASLKRWFFITGRRVGTELFLETETGTPLTLDALRQTLGETGTVYTTAGDYRRAVDDRLFRLGEERYQALIELLIQLRQPQLSRQLDEHKLSAALSNSLPPLDATVLQEVAESFRSLEEDRRSLENYETAVAAVASFRESYRRYARMVCGLRSEALRKLHSRYEKEQSDVREADAGLTAAAARRTAASTAVEEQRLACEGSRAEQEALRASPEMKQAEQLERLDRERRGAEDRRVRARDELCEHREWHAQRAADAAQAREKAAHDEAEAANANAKAEAAAELLGVRADVQRALADADSPEAARQRVEIIGDRLAESVRHLRRMKRDVERAEAEVERAADREQRQRERFDAARTRETACAGRRQTEADAYLQAASAWAGALELLELRDGADELLERAARWTESLAPPQPVDEAAQRAQDEGVRALERRRQAVRAERAAIQEQAEALATEQAALLAGEDRAPPAPPTRAADARLEQGGAPLWRICDFREAVGARERAMLEAALEASGLLDAWVTPEGTLRAAADGDALLAPTAAPCPTATRSLNTVLCVSIDPEDSRAATIPREAVDALLARIAVGACEHHTYVTMDGRWRHNLLHGRWRKPSAEYIGAATRAESRRRRLAVIAEERAALTRREAVCADELEAVALTEAALRTEFEARPSPQPILEADQDCRHAQDALNRERDELLHETEELHARHEVLLTLRAEYRRTATDLRLARWSDDLDGLDGALAAFIATLGELWLALERLRSARRNADTTACELERADQRLRRLEESARVAESEAVRLHSEFEALRATAGQAAQEVKARLDGARQRLRDAEQALEQARRLEAEARDEYARFDERRQAAQRRLEEVEAQRAAELEAFRGFVETRIVAEADLPLERLPDPARAAELAVNPAVEFARDIDRVLSGAKWDDDTRDRIQNELLRRFQELQSTLTAHEYTPVSETHHDMTIVTCPYQGKSRSMGELGRCLQDEVNQRRQLLAANERRFIENYLIGEVAHHLHRQIRDADRLVADMNAELDARPMSSGMRLRFVWTPRTDGPAGLAEARRLLAQAQEILSPEDRDTLAGFLQERIREVREAGESGSWRETLEQAVDYRQWHMFGIERHQAGRWSRLTRRTHGTGSGGEKAIALTIPQFAAAAAHYHNIPQAPRLIMLDEAFVGIDSDMRGKCMDLLHQFDLDFVMTSEREWGCYATTRGLAIYQLATRPDIDAIAVTRWVWNGREKLRRDTPPPARPRAGSEHKDDASAQSELFAPGDSA